MRAFTRKITLLMTLVTLLLGAASCTKKGASGKPSNVDYYTCTMHPSVKSQDPNGKCPICSMDLVPVKKKGASAEHDHGQITEGAKSDAKSMGMSEEEHAKMAGGKGKQDMKGMKGMEGMKGLPGMPGTQKHEMKEEEPSEFMVAVSRQQQ